MVIYNGREYACTELTPLFFSKFQKFPKSMISWAILLLLEFLLPFPTSKTPPSRNLPRLPKHLNYTEPTATMGKPRRHAHAADQESLTPPDQLTDSQSIARVIKAEGNSNYVCELPNKKTILVELESRFRNTIWIKRGGYVLVDLGSMEERSKTGSKVVGEIINIVRDEKAWRKEAYWYVEKLPGSIIAGNAKG